MQLSAAGPAETGFVVEAVIGGTRLWLVPPMPGERYTFSPELSRACRWELFYEAGTTRDCVWCGYFDPAWKRVGPGDTLRVRKLTDAYRAEVARDVTPVAVAGPQTL